MIIKAENMTNTENIDRLELKCILSSCPVTADTSEDAANISTDAATLPYFMKAILAELIGRVNTAQLPNNQIDRF